MSVTNEFESNVEVTKQTRYIFSLLGLWPMMTNNTTVMEKRVSAVIRLVCHSLLAFIIIPGSIQLYSFEGLELKLAYFAPFGTATASALKFLAILNRREEIKKCVTQIEQDCKEISNKTMNAIILRNFKTGQWITTICACYMYSGGILHQIMMPFLPGSMVSIFDNTTKRLLVYPISDMLFDHQITPVYQILYITHIAVGVFICTILVGSCHLAILFIYHILGQNQIMILKLTDLLDVQAYDERELNQRFEEIIHYHHKIMKFMSNVDKSLREICLTAILEALFLICFAEYSSMTAWNHNETSSAFIYLIVVQAFIGNFFIFCHVGELLAEQFQKTGEAVYMTEWYCLSQRNVKALMFIMVATQHPPKITAGGLVELSHSSFVSIIKTTAAYFNMLRMRQA